MWCLCLVCVYMCMELCSVCGGCVFAGCVVGACRLCVCVFGVCEFVGKVCVVACFVCVW